MKSDGKSNRERGEYEDFWENMPGFSFYGRTYLTTCFRMLKDEGQRFRVFIYVSHEPTYHFQETFSANTIELSSEELFDLLDDEQKEHALFNLDLL